MPILKNSIKKLTKFVIKYILSYENFTIKECLIILRNNLQEKFETNQNIHRRLYDIFAVMLSLKIIEKKNGKYYTKSN